MVCRSGSSVSSIRMTANTIEARPRGPNQPRNASVGRGAPGPSSASATGGIGTRDTRGGRDREESPARQAEKRVEHDLPRHFIEYRAEDDGAEDDEIYPL